MACFGLTKRFAMKRITMRKVKDILRLRLIQKLSQRECAHCLGVSPSTVWDTVRRFRLTGLDPSQLESMIEQDLEQLIYPSPNIINQKKIRPDFSTIQKELSKPGVTLALLWEEFRLQHPDGIGYSHFAELYGKYKKSLKVWLRQIHKAGEKVFVDYSGKRPFIVDRQTGEVKKMELFVACWGNSHYTYAEAQETQKLPCFLMGHARAFEFFGCVPKLCVPDCLKSAVSKAHRYDPDVNLAYSEMAEHYGVGILPARPAKPKDKAKVELSVQIVQRWILAKLRNKTFFSLGELNQAIRALLEPLNNRPMKKLNKSRKELFLELDKPHASALPKHGYFYRHWKQATVGLDYHIEIEKNYYSVPYQLYGKCLNVRIGEDKLEVFSGQEPVVCHKRRHGMYQYTTLTTHMPLRHQNHVQWTPERLMQWAGKAGKHTKALIQRIINQKAHPEQGFRPALGIKRLGDSFGEADLERVSSYALQFGLYRVDQIRDVLKRRLYLNHEQAKEKTIIAKQNIRGNQYYQPQQRNQNL